MKKALFLLFMVSPLFFTDCTNQKSNPVEGFWDLQYYEWTSPDTTVTFTRTELDRQVKVFGKEYFTFIIQSVKNDSLDMVVTDGGGGTYVLKGDTLVETIQLFPEKGALGYSMTYIIETSGDSLIQKGPINEDLPEGWKEWSGTEIYTRLE
ncbi:MAG: hypothetical protein JW723_05330 [Bacteroidales bacterium]|nr:hypothetical protein [Bacteroidales bacterium]